MQDSQIFHRRFLAAVIHASLFLLLPTMASAETPQAGGEVSGIVVTSDGTPIAGKAVFLSKVAVLERDSQGDFHRAKSLPATKPFRVFTLPDFKPFEGKTDSKGRFQFKDIAPDRYSVGIGRSGKIEPGESKYEPLYDSAGMVIFDLQESESVDVGKVHPEE